MSRGERDVMRRLLDAGGTTYAEEAGIRLRDKPSPLYRLLVLTMLSSTRISTDIAVGAARELSAAGWRTPQRLLDSTWQQRVDALGRAHYRRYDESTATKLAEQAQWLLETCRGDLRRLRPTSRDDAETLIDALTESPRIGPVGARIFCREVQDVWPELSPFLDGPLLEQAREFGLPEDPDELASLVPDGRCAPLAAALTRARHGLPGLEES
ncbi:endonuclease [Nocardioides sp.]|uniref:endonuclease n=1 Tax=Nocardioides sp. TaxID=35761 RepID=UPI0025F3D02C|nr:endonuclease [Nocardioides sp.]